VTGLAWVGGRGALGYLRLSRLLGRLAPSFSGVRAVAGDEGAGGGESAVPTASEAGFADAAAGFAGAGLAGGEGLPVGDSATGFAGLPVGRNSAAAKSSNSAAPITRPTTTRLSRRMATRGIMTVGSARDVSTGGAGESLVLSALGRR
jgi:hypothetical protein